MRCISPLTLRAPDGSFNTVPCNKCNFCLETRRADWTFRIRQEAKLHVDSHFLTLTYEDGTLPEGGNLVKEHAQNFLKRLRKMISPLKARYYLVGEYGTETGRAHYHAIMFGCPYPWMFSQAWQNGYVDVGTVDIASIHYVTKYHVNRYGDSQGREPPFCLMSRGGKGGHGIGFNYLNTHYGWHRLHMANYAKVNGVISRLPRYYKEKIFDERERASMAQMSIEAGDIQYLEEIEKLKQFSTDAYYYYDERTQFAHDAISHKSNHKNKF